MKIITRAEAKISGFKRYFTGRPCPSGHNAERFTKNATCTICQRTKQLTWQKNNVAKRVATNKRYRDNNREIVRAFGRAWASRNKQKVSEKNKSFRTKHPDRLRAARKRWAANNPDKVRAHRRAYYYQNKSLVQERNNIRRASRRAAGGRYSTKAIHEISSAQRNRCAYCRVLLSKTKRHIDHIIPISKGGTSDRRNIQLLCQTCNLEKHARDPIDFARLKGRLL